MVTDHDLHRQSLRRQIARRERNKLSLSRRWDFEADCFDMLGPMPLRRFKDIFSSLARPTDVLASDACLMQSETVNTFWNLAGVGYAVGSEQINTGWRP